MYESHINNLTALFKGKREKSKEYLIEVIRKDPYNLTEELLNAPDKAWPYISEIIRSNPKGVFLAILRLPLIDRTERFLTDIGYRAYIPLIREFHSKMAEINNYRKEGIPLNYEPIHGDFILGNVEKAVKEIKALAIKGRKLSVHLNRWKELKSLADTAGESIPDISPAIKKLDIDEAERIIGAVDENHLREKAKLMDMYRETDSALKEIEWVEGGKELREGLEGAKNPEEIGKIRDKAVELKSRADRVLSIWGVWGDEEIREIMKNNIEEAEKQAKKRRGLDALNKASGISELFEKSYSDWVRSVQGFTANGKAYILAGGDDNKLHVYDEQGNKLFEKSYSSWVLSVHGFTAGGKVYLLAGGYDKKFHFYDGHGNIVFEKSYSDWVLSVHGLTADGKAYILAGGDDNKLHVYDEQGNKLFEKSYSYSVYSVHGFTANGKAYILAGGVDKKLHVYDEQGNKLFEKSYSDWVRSVHGFTANGKAYILAGGNDNKLHVYDGHGNKLFEKSYSDSLLSLHGFTANGKAYILAGGEDKKLHVYDEQGNKLFEKSYSDSLLSVQGFTANGKAYILAGGEDKKLHVYSVVFMDTPTLLSLIEWSGKVGIDTNFEEIIEIALEEPEKGLGMAKNLLEQLEEKKKEHEKLKTEWTEISRRYKNAGLEIGDMPTKYEELKNRLKELRAEAHKPSLSTDLSGEISENIWSKAEITIKNDGEINLENISIEFQSKVVESEGIKQVPVLKKGEERKIPIRIKSRDAGYVPVEILAKYTNPLTEQEEEKRIFPEIYVKEKGMKEGGKEKRFSKGKRHIDIPEEEEKMDLSGVGDFFSYKIGDHIGSGGFSDVYEIVDKDGLKYAMKLPLNVDLTGNKTYELPDKVLQGFIKEARIWNRLTERNIPNIVQLYGFGVRPFPWFVMDLCDESLAQRMGKMGFNEKIDTLAKVLTTLNEIHYLGIVHRDIKPQNILFRDDGPFLTDFGLGKALNKASKSSQGYSGTLEYSSPEQFNRKLGGSDRRTDIWQVGVLAYEMFTGRVPFEGDDITEIMYAVLNEEPEHPSDVNNKVPRELGDAVMKALSKRKEDRWQSSEAFKRALEGVK